MKRYGEAPEGGGHFRIVTDPVSISRKTLEELCNRLEARLPNQTVAKFISDSQMSVNERILQDQFLINTARKILSP